MDYASQVVVSSAMWMAGLRLPVAAHRKADAFAFLWTVLKACMWRVRRATFRRLRPRANVTEHANQRLVYRRWFHFQPNRWGARRSHRCAEHGACFLLCVCGTSRLMARRSATLSRSV